MSLVVTVKSQKLWKMNEDYCASLMAWGTISRAPAILSLSIPVLLAGGITFPIPPNVIPWRGTIVRTFPHSFQFVPGRFQIRISFVPHRFPICTICLFLFRLLGLSCSLVRFRYSLPVGFLCPFFLFGFTLGFVCQFLFVGLRTALPLSLCVPLPPEFLPVRRILGSFGLTTTTRLKI
ncbi:hypothetical protein C8J56DRAFT_970744 [Mycena floridula]|nr:hypothetical protein C8J56DRAFT_970744 [Mycena floridula]